MDSNEDSQKPENIPSPVGNPTQTPITPQQSQLPPQQDGNMMQPGSQFIPPQPASASEEATAGEQPPYNYSNSQVESSQVQPQKNKTFIILAVVVSLLLIGGITAFALIGSNSDSNKSNNEQAGNNINNEKPELNDVKRKTNVAKFLTEVNNFQANNNGKLPSFEEARTELIDEYIFYKDKNTEFNDPKTGEKYIIVAASPEIGEIQYAEASTCSGDEIVPANKRQAAVRTLLESGEYVCLSS